VKIFLDTSFIVAYAVDKDDNNQLAIELENKGIFKNECFISNLIINEIITVIGNKEDLKTAIEIFETVKDNCIIINEYNTTNFNEKVIKTYKKYNTNLSFTDSAIIEIMKENNINKLVSFDKYFDRVDDIERIY
jgi:predicted nucleic acid-binding protein